MMQKMLPFIILTLLLNHFLQQENDRSARIAFLVAVSHYPDNEKMPLTSASSDMDSLRIALEHRGYQVYVLRDSLATKAAILQQLEQIGASVAGIREFQIFLGGHGFRYDGKDFFIPYDGHLDSLSANIYVEDFYKKMQSYKATVNLLLTDICRTPSTRSTGRKIGPLPEEVKDTFYKEEQHNFLIKAAGPQQYAYEADFGFGIFTYHYWKLLNDRKIQQRADRNKSGNVTMGELFSYLKSQTVQHAFMGSTESNRRDQQPEWQLQGNPDVVFLKIDKLADPEPGPEATAESPPKGIDCKPCQKMIARLAEGLFSEPPENKKRKRQGLYTENGITICHDVGDFILSGKPFGLVFFDHPQIEWSRRMKRELLYAPELRSFVKPGGPFQVISHHAWINRADVTNEVLDLNYLTPGEKAVIEPLFRKGTIQSPGILILYQVARTESDPFEKVYRLAYWPGYTKPGNLAEKLAEISDLMNAD